MSSKNELLFKTIVKAYKDNHLKETIDSLLNRNDSNLAHLPLVIPALCGADVSYSEHFSEQIEYAVKNNKPSSRIIIQIGECSSSCIDIGETPPCQSVCPFESISVDPIHNSLVIDNANCISCGFCINACPSNSLIDKSEFLPLFALLK